MEIYLQESMPTDLPTKDYSIYFIPEHLSDFEKLNHIIKKGKPFQHQALLTNIHQYLPNTSLFQSLLTYIINNLSLWDHQTQLIFPSFLYNTLSFFYKTPSYTCSFLSSITNTIFKHMLNAITIYNKNISEEYIHYFELIIELIHNEINNKKLNIELKSELIEFVISLGKFGSSVFNRKLSLFFCTRLSLINKSVYLFNRYILLSGDTEKEIQMQSAFELKYFLKVYYDDDIMKNNHNEENEFVNCIVDYYLKNIDKVIQCETICSLIDNINIVSNNKQIVSCLYEVLFNIFSERNYEMEYLCRLVKMYVNKVAMVVKEKKFLFENGIKLAKEIIEMFINNINTSDLQSVSTLLECYDNINIVLNECNTNEEMILMKVFQIITSDTMLNNSNNNYKELFYVHLDKVIQYLPKGYNKTFILNTLNNNNNNNHTVFTVFSITNFNLFVNNSNIRNVFHIISSSLKKNHVHIIPYIISIISSISIKNNSYNNISLEKLIILANEIKHLIKELFSYSNKEQSYTQLSIFIKNIISNNNGYLITNAYIKLFAHLIKYSKNRNDYLTYINNCIYDNQSFYIRRLYKPFLIEIFDLLSLTFIIENNIFNNYINSIEDKVPSLSCVYIDLFTQIYPLVCNNENSNQVINLLKTMTYNKDIELNKTISNVINHCKNISTVTIEHSKNKDNKKLKHELQIQNKENDDNNNTNNTQKAMFSLVNTNEHYIKRAKNNTMCEFNINKPLRSFSKESSNILRGGRTILPPMNINANSCSNKESKKFVLYDCGKGNKGKRRGYEDNGVNIKHNNTIIKGEYLGSNGNGWNNNNNGGVDNITYSNFYSLKALNYKTKLFVGDNHGSSHERKGLSPLVGSEYLPKSCKGKSTKNVTFRNMFKFNLNRSEGNSHMNFMSGGLHFYGEQKYNHNGNNISNNNIATKINTKM